MNRSDALKLCIELASEHNLTITEIFGPITKNDYQVRERFILQLNGYEDMARHLAASHVQDPNKVTPQESGMSPGRCPV